MHHKNFTRQFIEKWGDLYNQNLDPTITNILETFIYYIENIEKRLVKLENAKNN